VSHEAKVVHDFGGKQETNYIEVAGIRMTLAERDAILHAANQDYERGSPWAIASQNKWDIRYAPTQLRKRLKKTRSK
jgi:hypothetical protein